MAEMAESEQVDPPHTFDMTDDIPNNAHTELAPMDRGKQANLILLGCSLLQLPVWAFPISYPCFRRIIHRTRQAWRVT